MSSVNKLLTATSSIMALDNHYCGVEEKRTKKEAAQAVAVIEAAGGKGTGKERRRRKRCGKRQHCREDSQDLSHLGGDAVQLDVGSNNSAVLVGCLSVWSVWPILVRRWSHHPSHSILDHLCADQVECALHPFTL
jgi:hypothetical protein